MHVVETMAVLGSLHLVQSGPASAQDQAWDADMLQLHAGPVCAFETQARGASWNWVDTGLALSWFDAANGLGVVGH